MPRIPYQPADLAEPKDLVQAIRARRRGQLLNLDRMLLYSPPLAKGWNAFLREVRNELSLPPKLLELAVCVVAVLTRADYEFHHHAPEFLRAGGSERQVEALRSLPQAGELSAAFDTVERAVIALASEMTRSVEVAEETFAAARAALPSERQLVELVAVVATYNMVSRFLLALKVAPE